MFNYIILHIYWTINICVFD